MNENKLYDDYNYLQVKQQVGFKLKDNKTILHMIYFVKQINIILIKIMNASQMGSVHYCDQTYKPSSVVNSHLSWPGVATTAHATFSKHAGQALYVSLRCCSE